MNVLDSALYTRLQGTAITSLLSGTASIYKNQAPEGAALPYIVFSKQTGRTENLDANRVDSLLYYVRAYSENSAAQAGSIDAQVDAALHLVPLTVSGWTNIWLARETVIELPSTEPSGQVIHSAGALYRIIVDKE